MVYFMEIPMMVWGYPHFRTLLEKHIETNHGNWWGLPQKMIYMSGECSAPVGLDADQRKRWLNHSPISTIIAILHSERTNMRCLTFEAVKIGSWVRPENICHRRPSTKYIRQWVNLRHMMHRKSMQFPPRDCRVPIPVMSVPETGAQTGWLGHCLEDLGNTAWNL